MLARIAKPGAIYFALAFGAGFVLGPIRVLWAVPRFGERAAELMEAPIMLVVVVFAARWTVRRFGRGLSARGLLAVGVFALALLLVAELTVVLALRGMTIAQYIESRDPVSGTVYVLMLIVFAAMPALHRRQAR